MRRKILVLAVCGFFGLSGAVFAATGADFGLKIVLDKADAGTTATVGGQVTLTTAVEGVQGWSFGVLLEADPGVTASITRVARAADVEAVKDGDPADFNTTSYFTAADLANKAGDCEPACEGIEAVGFTQGVVIDFMQKVSLPAVEDFGLVDFQVAENASGLEPNASGQVRLNFTNELGTPAVTTVLVHGGASIPPEAQEGGTLTVTNIPCAPPAPFTIEIEGGSGATDAEVQSAVKLNFNADGSTEGQEVQGWSYAICLQDPAKLGIIDATTDGTDTGTVKDGDPPDFDTVTVYPDEGITHGVVIDFRAGVTVPAQNGWLDMLVTYQIRMDTDGDVTYVTPCNKRLGSPPVANVMVIGGSSIPASVFEGTDPAAPEGGCCDPNICNIPGEFVFVPGVKVIPGDANGDGRLDIADGIYILNWLFRGGPPLPCEKAGDANGDCVLDSSDAVYIIEYQFLDGPPPVYGVGCQLLTPDVCPDLSCENPTGCE